MTRTKFNIMQDSGIYQIQSRVGGKIYIGSSQNI